MAENIKIAKANELLATVRDWSKGKFVAKVEGYSLTKNDFTDALKTKLDGIAEGATKVESSDNGKIKINGTATTVYTHPAYTAADAAFKKVGLDATGHVVLGDAIVKTDLTDLIGAATQTTGDLGLMSAVDKIKFDGISTGANKVEASTNGKIKIDGTDTTVYTHPTDGAAHDAGIYKIATNAAGHVTSATAAVKADLTDIIGNAEGTTETGTSGIMTAAQAKKLEGIAAGAQVNVLEGVQVNGSALTATNKVVNVTVVTGDNNGEIKVNGAAVAVKGLGDSAYATVYNGIDKEVGGFTLDARQGKVLADRIEAVEDRGRYLSSWDCTTGKPETDPTSLPYAYKSGDYYIINKVVDGAATDNLIPAGSSYTGAASTTHYAGSLTPAVGDTYQYDGTQWTLVKGAVKTVTFRQIAGSPADNTNLAAALNGKVDNTITINDEALTADVTLNGDNVKLSEDYAKASAAAAIAAEDKLDVAIGKLEYKIDQAVAGGIVDTTLTMPTDEFSVTHSVANNVASLSVAFKNQEAHKVFAGPNGGTAAAPAFRDLVIADISDVEFMTTSEMETILNAES